MGWKFDYMVKKIERDSRKFRQIIRGKIKKELKKYITKAGQHTYPPDRTPVF